MHTNYMGTHIERHKNQSEKKSEEKKNDFFFLESYIITAFARTPHFDYQNKTKRAKKKKCNWQAHELWCFVEPRDISYTKQPNCRKKNKNTTHKHAESTEYWMLAWNKWNVFNLDRYECKCDTKSSKASKSAWGTLQPHLNSSISIAQPKKVGNKRKEEQICWYCTNSPQFAILFGRSKELKWKISV